LWTNTELRRRRRWFWNRHFWHIGHRKPLDITLSSHIHLKKRYHSTPYSFYHLAKTNNYLRQHPDFKISTQTVPFRQKQSTGVPLYCCTPTITPPALFPHSVVILLFFHPSSLSYQLLDYVFIITICFYFHSKWFSSAFFLGTNITRLVVNQVVTHGRIVVLPSGALFMARHRIWGDVEACHEALLLRRKKTLLPHASHSWGDPELLSCAIIDMLAICNCNCINHNYPKPSVSSMVGLQNELRLDLNIPLGLCLRSLSQCSSTWLTPSGYVPSDGLNFVSYVDLNLLCLLCLLVRFCSVLRFLCVNFNAFHICVNFLQRKTSKHRRE